MKKIITTVSLCMALFVQNGFSEAVKISDVEREYTVTPTVNASNMLKQQLDFGLFSTTGNSDTLSINGKYALSFTLKGYNANDLKIAGDASVFVTKNNGIRDNEEYTINLGLEQELYQGWLGYGAVSWLRNTFRNFDSKYAIGIGVGKQVFEQQNHSLKVKLGVAYNKEAYSNLQANNTYASLNEYVEYQRQFNEVSRLYVKVGASQNFDNFSDYDVLAVAGLHFAVAENLSLSLEEEVRYDHIPPIGFDKTDTKSIVRVGYSF
jgi:putative salt-induced outer membrane protein YdiY